MNHNEHQQPEPRGAQAPAGLKVYPAKVELRGKDDRQSLVIQAVDGQGVTRDVTTVAKLRLADPTLAGIAGSTLSPRRDGQTQLVIEHAGARAEVPVVVTEASRTRPVSSACIMPYLIACVLSRRRFSALISALMADRRAAIAVCSRRGGRVIS